MSSETSRIDDDPPPFIRSPSPKKHTSNVLGLGIPPTPINTSVLTTYPHLGHYIYNLLQSISSSPPRISSGSASSGLHHPLSVSSSGESDGSDEDEVGNGGQKTPKKKNGNGNGTVAIGGAGEKEILVRDIVELLDNEEEEEVKERLRPYLGDLAKVSYVDQGYIISCMVS